MEIFLITFDDLIDYTPYRHHIEAFSRYEDAKVRFDFLVAEAKEMIRERNLGWHENDSIHSYEAFPEGSWCTEHYAIYLDKTELK